MTSKIAERTTSQFMTDDILFIITLLQTLANTAMSRICQNVVQKL